jgi:hypothetical protein
MSIIRRASDSNPFTAISNATLQDHRGLSLDSLGLLVYLLSKPLDWRVMSNSLMKEWGIGKDRYYRIVKELRDAGYMQISVYNDEKGYRVTEYVVSDGKIPDDTASGLTASGATGSGYQEATKERDNKIQTETKTSLRIANATAQRNDHFDALWKIYPRKADKIGARKQVERRLISGVSIEELAEATRNYATQRSGQDPERHMYGKTFWNNERWKDWLSGGPETDTKLRGRDARNAAADDTMTAITEYFQATGEGREIRRTPIITHLLERFTLKKLGSMPTKDLCLVIEGVAQQLI